LYLWFDALCFCDRLSQELRWMLLGLVEHLGLFMFQSIAFRFVQWIHITTTQACGHVLDIYIYICVMFVYALFVYVLYVHALDVDFLYVDVLYV